MSSSSSCRNSKLPNIAIASVNIRGLLSSRVTNKLNMNLAEFSKYDIVCVQETHNVDDELRGKVSRNYDGKVFWNSPLGARAYKGTAIFVKEFAVQNAKCENVFTDRVQKLSFSWADNEYIIFNIYAPTTNNADDIDVEDWFNDFTNILKQTITGSDATILLTGDFNSVEDMLDRSTSVLNSGDMKAAKMYDYLKAQKYAEVWRSLNANDRRYSFNSTVGCSRIDRAYILKSNLKWIVAAQYVPALTGLSDHDLLVVKITSPQLVRWGSSFWKLNVSLLDNDDVVQKLEVLWRNWHSHKVEFRSLNDWWEVGKLKVTELLKRQSKNAAKCRRTRESDLEHLIQEITRNAHNNVNVNDQSIQQLKAYKQELVQLKNYKVQGAKVRLHCKDTMTVNKEWYAKASKNRKEPRALLALRDQQHVLQTEKSEIINITSNFFSNLYTPGRTCEKAQLHFLSFLSQRLTAEESANLEKFFTNQELFTALNSMAKGKSPGRDGLNKEFYTKLWHVIGDDFTEVVNNSWLCGRLPPSMKEAIITLLYKKGDAQDISNWRPISLLNVDYKILSKAVANRFTSVMDRLIHYSQACGVKGRSIQEQAVFLKLIEKYLLENDIDAHLAALDLKNAFDRVSHNWIFLVLSALNFGQRMMLLVTMMYSELTSSVEINGLICKPFPVKRGTRQGCPLSMLIYVLCIEPLLCAIRANDNVRSLYLPLKEGVNDLVKNSTYADDNTLIVQDCLSVAEAIKVYKYFGEASEAQINENKTEIVRYGSRTQDSRCLNRHWIKPIIKILGLYFGKQSSTFAWNLLLEKMRVKISEAPSYFFGFHDKKKFLETYVVSKVWHTVAADPPSKEIIQKFERMYYSFLFNNGREAIARNTLALPAINGGLAIVRPALKIISIRINVLVKLITARTVTERPLYSGLLAYFIGFDIRKWQPWAAGHCVMHMERFLTSKDPVKEMYLFFKDFAETYPHLNLDRLSVKVIYTNLVVQKKSRLVSQYPALPWQNIFLHNLSSSLTNYQREMNLKFLYSALPLQYCFPMESQLCHICKKHSENVAHLVAHCENLSKLYAMASSCCKKVNSQLVYCEEAVLYGGAHCLGQSDPQQRILVRLLTGLKITIWRLREQKRKSAPTVNFDEILAWQKIVKGLKNHIDCDIRTLGRDAAKDMWHIPGVLEINDTFLLFLL